MIAEENSLKAEKSGDFDLIIVGAGTSGMAAAIAAARAGGRILLLDAAEKWGGTLHVATGWLSAAGTRLQRECGIDDSPNEHLQDLVRISKGTINQELAHKAVLLMPDTFDWLVENGFEVSPECPVHGANHEPYSKARYYVGANKGRSVLAVLERILRPMINSWQVDFRPAHEVISLIRQGDRVIGVRTSSSAGENEFRAPHVVLASGGYNSDPVEFERLSGRVLYARDSYPFATGAGHGLGVSAGGYLRGGENFWCSFGSVLDSFNYPSPTLCQPEHRPEVRKPWEISVNRRGERFVAEDNPSVDAREAALMEQPDQIRFIVFDEGILDSAPPLILGWSAADIRAHSNVHPMFNSAQSVAGLAQAVGVPSAVLEATVQAYNETLEGRDPLGRTHMPLPISQPQFYAITVHGTSVTSAAGLAVDEKLRVIREDGVPVDGLYAIGELLGSGILQGKAFCGGMLATPALAFGLELGATLAGSLRKS